MCVPNDLDGASLRTAAAFVTTVGSTATTVQIRSVTNSVDMLSTAVTVDANEFSSYTAATAPVIDTAHAVVAAGDLVAVDVDAAGTGAQGLGVMLGFA